MKVACTVWGGGKAGDNFKDLPIVKSVYSERKHTSQGWHTFYMAVNKTETDKRLTQLGRRIQKNSCGELAKAY